LHLLSCFLPLATAAINLAQPLSGLSDAETLPAAGRVFSNKNLYQTVNLIY